MNPACTDVLLYMSRAVWQTACVVIPFIRDPLSLSGEGAGALS